MAYTHGVTGIVLIVALAAAPVFAADGQRRRPGADRRGEQTQQQAPPADAARERAVPRSRSEGQQNEAQRQDQAQRQNEAQRQNQAQRQNEAQRQNQAQRQNEAQRQYQSQRQNEAQRQYQAQRQNEAQRQYDARRSYAVPRQYYPYYSNRGYGSRTMIVPRIIRPSIVTIVPYRPYVYRPSIGRGVYYGAGGYPYGYTPRGYYDPIPGRFYGGVRITDAPRDAQVFADGYYVGIANDFDGVFQHMNLEAGPHHIEIVEPGFEPIAFDVIVQPGRTITFRADVY